MSRLCDFPFHGLTEDRESLRDNYVFCQAFCIKQQSNMWICKYSDMFTCKNTKNHYVCKNGQFRK